MNENKKRGGLRSPAGGRPPLAEGAQRVFHSIGFDPEVWKWLQTLGREKNNIINNILLDHIKQQQHDNF